MLKLLRYEALPWDLAKSSQQARVSQSAALDLPFDHFFTKDRIIFHCLVWEFKDLTLNEPRNIVAREAGARQLFPDGRNASGAAGKQSRDPAVNLPHGKGAQVRGTSPAQFAGFERTWFTARQAAFKGVQGDGKMCVGVFVFANFPPNFDFNIEFLADLARQGFGQTLTGFQFAAREFP